ncbi:Sushi, nidogen and EGF-like domain-containing protein 1 [Frankliniella fusca]|uniref:Sushi, nidogen and EGF-like domain-containing protein 1 n=1 Tax=Frankliniella fusca TaxID=407009 RepID=A0AAE1LRH6_9NEOP|nr:Sushi, nidogen and EGF-like domain-containing protein 1 [Frankliniella fusca]
MTPIIAVFMSMISLLALVADRANLQEQTLSVHGASIPLPNVDDGVARNFLDVAKRTLPFKMTPARAITLRRVPRAAGSASVYKLRSGPAPSTGLGPAAPGGRDLDLASALTVPDPTSTPPSSAPGSGAEHLDCRPGYGPRALRSCIRCQRLKTNLTARVMVSVMLQD